MLPNAGSTAARCPWLPAPRPPAAPACPPVYLRTGPGVWPWKGGLLPGMQASGQGHGQAQSLAGEETVVGYVNAPVSI